MFPQVHAHSHVPGINERLSTAYRELKVKHSNSKTLDSNNFYHRDTTRPHIWNTPCLNNQELAEEEQIFTMLGYSPEMYLCFEQEV